DVHDREEADDVVPQRRGLAQKEVERNIERKREAHPDHPHRGDVARALVRHVLAGEGRQEDSAEAPVRHGTDYPQTQKHTGGTARRNRPEASPSANRRDLVRGWARRSHRERPMRVGYVIARAAWRSLPPAVTMGDLTLVRSLGLAKIPSIVVTTDP